VTRNIFNCLLKEAREVAVVKDENHTRNYHGRIFLVSKICSISNEFQTVISVTARKLSKGNNY